MADFFDAPTSGECGHMLAVFHLFPVPELGASKKSAMTELPTQRALYFQRVLPCAMRVR